MAMMPPYRMQTLFELREKAKGDAENVYAQKMAVVVEEQKKLDDMKQTLRDMADAREAKKLEYAEKIRSGELNVQQIRGNDHHIERLKQEEAAYQVDISRQAEAVRDAEDDAEQAKELMLEATKEFKALEKHKEKWLKQVKKERSAKEEDAAEDIAQAQYFAKMKEEGEP